MIDLSFLFLNLYIEFGSKVFMVPDTCLVNIYKKSAFFKTFKCGFSKVGA
jgi:hypothetical protein